MFYEDHGAFEPYRPAAGDHWADLAAQMPYAEFFRSTTGVDLFLWRDTAPAGRTWLKVRDNGRIQVATNDVHALVPEAGTRFVSIDQVPDPGTIENKLLVVSGQEANLVDPPPFVPGYASKLGLKRALGSRWPEVKAWLAADPDRQEEWDLATTVLRSDPLTQAAMDALGLDEAEVDQLILQAHALTT